MVAVMERNALPHDRYAQMPMGFFGRERHSMMDSENCPSAAGRIQDACVERS